MGNYSVYGKYYDSLNSDYSYWISFLRKHIRSKNTGEKKLLELGCGTGNILKEFTEEYKLFGIDLSDEMLAAARNKINSCRFIKADMSEYFENIKYDVISDKSRGLFRGVVSLFRAFDADIRPIPSYADGVVSLNLYNISN